jgi:hypothetical protein
MLDSWQGQEISLLHSVQPGSGAYINIGLWAVELLKIELLLLLLLLMFNGIIIITISI